MRRLAPTQRCFLILPHPLTADAQFQVQHITDCRCIQVPRHHWLEYISIPVHHWLHTVRTWHCLVTELLRGCWFHQWFTTDGVLQLSANFLGNFMVMVLLDELTQLFLLLLGDVALVALHKGQQTLVPKDRQLPTITHEPAHSPSYHSHLPWPHAFPDDSRLPWTRTLVKTGTTEMYYERWREPVPCDETTPQHPEFC